MIVFKRFRQFLVAACLGFSVLVTPPANACCGDGAAAALGATAAGGAVVGAITAATGVIVLWLERMTMTIASGFGKVVAEIMKQTASQRVMSEGNIAAQTQLYMEKARADAQSKYELSSRACYESAGGAAAGVAAGETREAMNDLNRSFANRTLFTANTSAAVGKIYSDHQQKYCSQQDADLGRCQAVSSTMQNADVRADTMLNSTSYTSEQIEAAKALVNNLANPTPTQNIPKDWEKTDQGKIFVAGQYIEQARASVAANSLNAAIASRVPIKGLGSAAMLNQADVSELDLMESQVRGRFESSAWYRLIAGFGVENLLREANKMQALKLWMDLKSYQQMERIEMVLATQLAIDVKRDSEQRLREARSAASKAGQ
ncbi:MAG: hypothetical protein KAX55_03320 [Propionivibrio sp.]|nr:hypothetical protein [Propionivibrio sp.]